jgi:LemA protein
VKARRGTPLRAHLRASLATAQGQLVDRLPLLVLDAARLRDTWSSFCFSERPHVVAVIIIVVLLVLVVGYFFIAYNGLIGLKNRAEEGFSDIDTQLKRRHDLIPNLVESVKGYAAHEQGTFTAVTAARGAAVNASGPAAQAAAEGALTGALGKLLAVAENYPDLKANQNFLQLQNELTDTEDKIQASRRFYNMQVRDLNTKVQSIPTNIIAGFAHVEKRDFFELENPTEDRAVPTVSF